MPGIPWCQALEITQDPLLEVSEGKDCNLNCSHPKASTETIFWYRQSPGQSLRYVTSGYTSNPEGTLYIPSDRKSNVLTLPRVSLGDAGVYYCALSDTVLFPGASSVQELISSRTRFKAGAEQICEDHLLFSCMAGSVFKA
ncbi:hypothetical protein JRQ81_004365 [Phrynocephalus forsythii]|uniref:Ig-like domain-containing protein n=1 Tax=Phrynocephalus forsythii TaxID=171643 RepID=A0A9Q0XF56_9SAUR|nr:hypothetical protein JRQ81_004365 [Phrynocephalus forsythii]